MSHWNDLLNDEHHGQSFHAGSGMKSVDHPIHRILSMTSGMLQKDIVVSTTKEWEVHCPQLVVEILEALDPSSKITVVHHRSFLEPKLKKTGWVFS